MEKTIFILRLVVLVSLSARPAVSGPEQSSHAPRGSLPGSRTAGAPPTRPIDPLPEAEEISDLDFRKVQADFATRFPPEPDAKGAAYLSGLVRKVRSEADPVEFKSLTCVAAKNLLLEGQKWVSYDHTRFRATARIFSGGTPDGELKVKIDRRYAEKDLVPAAPIVAGRGELLAPAEKGAGRPYLSFTTPPSDAPQGDTWTVSTVVDASGPKPDFGFIAVHRYRDASVPAPGYRSETVLCR